MSQLEKSTLISIIGPTAVGKTDTAIGLAQEFKAAIISSDSRQFYKELNIGTAKPNATELAAAKHHFIDNLSVDEDYNASDFEKDVLYFLESYFKSNSLAIMCGGSGMYVDAVLKGFDNEVPTSDLHIREKLNRQLELEGISSLQKQLQQLDPSFYTEVDLNNSKRLLRAIEVCLITGKPYSAIRKKESKVRDFKTIKIGLNLDREKLYDRINRRVDFMMQEGLLEEVKSVYHYKEKNALKTVGYKELFDYMDGHMTLDQSVEKIKINSRRYAKRQITWFKRDEEIEWFEPQQKAQIIEYIRSRN